MNIKRLILISVSVLALVCSVSCKKEEEETKPYLIGNPVFDLPAFGLPGDTFTFKSKGCMAEDSKKDSQIGYYWMAPPVRTDRDTTMEYTFTLPDSLCTVKVSCYSFSPDYYGTSTTKTITVISADREQGSIKGKTFDPKRDFVFTDPRDGRGYWCTTIGSTDWFKENLAWLGSGHTLQDCDETAGVFGNYYSWDEAMTACPEGWRVASRQDWADAAKSVTGLDYSLDENMYDVAGAFMGNIMFNGERMWAYWPDVTISDELGLALMPSGYGVIGERTEFKAMYEYAAVWTSDESGSDRAFYRYIFVERPDFMIGTTDRDSFAASVRCVRDHQ